MLGLGRETMGRKERSLEEVICRVSGGDSGRRG